MPKRNKEVGVCTGYRSSREVVVIAADSQMCDEKAKVEVQDQIEKTIAPKLMPPEQETSRVPDLANP